MELQRATDDHRRERDGVGQSPAASIDLYIGPDAPAGYQSNHMKTVGDDGCFVYFRLYAPLQPFFDKSFQLSDFEMID